MTPLLTMFLMFAPPAVATLDQVRAEPNLERRAKEAVEFAAAAERNAEAAYGKGDLKQVMAELNNMVAAEQMAQQALEQTGKSPMHHPGPFKYAELKTEEILLRLRDLEHKMDAEDREAAEGPRAKVQEIHDAWFDGIMSRKRK